VTTTVTTLYAASAVVAVWLALGLKRRLELSAAKHRSLAGHSQWSRRLAKLVRFYEYDDATYFRVDGAPDAVARQRRGAFMRLSERLGTRAPATLRATQDAYDGISDLQFTAHYRVPFQFARLVRKHLPSGSFVASSHGVELTDLDGNTLFDLTGSYGVNVFGYDFYKSCIEEGSKRVAALGPVLGLYHPLVGENVRRLREISGLDEVSFHMSGTEAVMQAVRLARYHTGKSHLVRFCGAYHGWWGDVQPGVGNPTTAHETYTLADLSPTTLRVLATRNDIACVLVNPLQALHPNSNAPGDSTLLEGRRPNVERERYAAWLRELREVCTARGIVLIFDEVFVGFRLARRGAQEYFGVAADMVTYGKTLGGGLPVGALCGRAALMKRFRETHPADICFARGTFNSHPYVMGAMHAFLERLDTPAISACYVGLEDTWNRRAHALNERLAAEELPVRVANLSTIWTITYTESGRYHWLLQYYLRAERLALSWVGSGRLIFSLNYSDADFAEVADRFVAAARSMQADGWWWRDPTLTSRSIKRQLLKEMLQQLVKSRRVDPPAPPVAPAPVDARELH
jgi:glutamate-1-semialdehyde 2,1-aminomutase